MNLIRVQRTRCCYPLFATGEKYTLILSVCIAGPFVPKYMPFCADAYCWRHFATATRMESMLLPMALLRRTLFEKRSYQNSKRAGETHTAVRVLCVAYIHPVFLSLDYGVLIHQLAANTASLHIHILIVTKSTEHGMASHGVFQRRRAHDSMAMRPYDGHGYPYTCHPTDATTVADREPHAVQLVDPVSIFCLVGGRPGPLA